VPSVLTLKYSLVISNAFGALSPHLLFLAAFYAGVKRHQWLTAGSKLKGAKLVKSLKVKGDNIIIKTFNLYGFSEKSFSLESIQIQLIENDLRRESYYVVRDLNSTSMYVMLIDEKSVIDVKSINNLSNLKKFNHEFNIRNVLMNRNPKIIDFSKTKIIRNEIDTLARMNLLIKYNDISKLSIDEVHKKLNSIPDKEINEFLENTSKSIGSSLPSIESSLVGLENLLLSLGIIREEAVSMTQLLRKSFSINGISDLSRITQDDLRTAFEACISKSQITFDDLTTKIQIFFQSLEKK
jgi:hypothetical protein